MVCKAYAEEKHLKYLQDLQEVKYSIGLIIGQVLEGSYHVLRLTQTSPCPRMEIVSTNIFEVTENCLAEHAQHTTRMLSGGLYIVGIFIVSDKNLFDPLSKHVASHVSLLDSSLGQDGLMYGNCTAMKDKLVMHMNRTTSHCDAIRYNSDAGTFSKVEIVFAETAQTWWHAQCKFEINETLVLSNNHTNLQFKTYIKDLLISVDSNLETALYLFNGKVRESEEIIGSFHTTGLTVVKNHHHLIKDDGNDQSIHVEILCKMNAKSPIKRTSTLESIGVIKMNGVIASDVWLHSKASWSHASNAVKEDITRSLTARLAMHCDSLTEGERGFITDISCIHELPRRVMISPEEPDVTFSDYLFPGEGTQDVVLTCQDVLNIGHSKLEDVEGQVDLSDVYSMMDAESNEQLVANTAGKGNVMFILGATVALIVLIVSLLIHYFTQ